LEVKAIKGLLLHDAADLVVALPVRKGHVLMEANEDF